MGQAGLRPPSASGVLDRMSAARIRVAVAVVGLTIALSPPALAAAHSLRLVTHGTWAANSEALHQQFQCVQRAIEQDVPAGTTVFIRVPGPAYGSFAILWRSRLPELAWPRLQITSAKKRAGAVLSVVQQRGASCGGAALVVTRQ
jgi:hypothetical protein